jgi:ubiquitin carboxyl-terminal hydrolase 30
LGDALSGHFVTYRRGGPANDSKWYYTSDSNVRQTELKEVLSSNAYMLFYERISSRTEQA